MDYVAVILAPPEQVFEHAARIFGASQCKVSLAQRKYALAIGGSHTNRRNEVVQRSLRLPGCHQQSS
jgi:hypothetical protein